MKANAPKNCKLMKRYPFLVGLINEDMEPFSSPLINMAHDLTIKVEKADGELMYRKADNIGLGESSCLFAFKGDHKGHVARRGEYIFAIDENNKIINRVNWPRNNDEQRKAGEEIFAWSVLWGTKDGKASYSNPIWSKVKYLVWVTVEAWYTDTKNDGALAGRFGIFHDRTVHITIYGRPKQGFEKLQDEASVYEHLRLDSRTMMEGALKKDHDIVTMGGMLYEMCISFQDEVYFNGMKEILDNGDVRGASGQFGSVKVLAAEMCGYDRVTLQDATSFVTFQLRPGSKHMYVLGQDGTLPQIRHLVHTVVRMWSLLLASREGFKPDQNVSVL